MKRKILKEGIALLALAFCFACASSTEAQLGGPENKAPEQFAASNYVVSGPYSHKNLTIFLLHGADQRQDKTPLTLQEAMERKMVVVHETGDVNNLAIENLSDEEVYVQSGDIVKGGQQDRVLALDLIVPPKSGRIPIDAFCVEQGRWSRRGNEAVEAFSASDNALASKDLKIAAKARKSQGEVWTNVGKAQEKLAANLAVAGQARMGAGGGRAADRESGIVATTRSGNVTGRSGRIGRGPGTGINGQTYNDLAGVASVTDRASPSSMQLTLENKLVKDTANDYVKNLSSIINGKRDVIGFVFAINGQINSADVYSSNALFSKLWPKMLEASAIEAIAELKAEEKFEPVDASAVKAFLRESQTGKPETKKVTARTSVVKHETEKNLFFESRDHARKGKWVHRNYITK
jgi:hypothetical protein